MDRKEFFKKEDDKDKGDKRKVILVSVLVIILWIPIGYKVYNPQFNFDIDFGNLDDVGDVSNLLTGL